MLSIKRETDYAVRTVLHLASVEEEARPQVRDVAAIQLLPLSFIRRIVARLSAAGILATTRGMGGGIRLARPASEISLLDVVRAMEDGIVMNQCLDGRHSCPLSSGCPAQSGVGRGDLRPRVPSRRGPVRQAGGQQHGAHESAPGVPGRSCRGPEAGTTPGEVAGRKTHDKKRPAPIPPLAAGGSRPRQLPQSLASLLEPVADAPPRSQGSTWTVLIVRRPPSRRR